MIGLSTLEEPGAAAMILYYHERTVCLQGHGLPIVYVVVP